MLAPFCHCDKWQSKGAVLFRDMNSYDAILRAYFDTPQASQWWSAQELAAYPPAARPYS
jgi:hypothetical protein